MEVNRLLVQGCGTRTTLELEVVFESAHPEFVWHPSVLEKERGQFTKTKGVDGMAGLAAQSAKFPMKKVIRILAMVAALGAAAAYAGPHKGGELSGTNIIHIVRTNIVHPKPVTTNLVLSLGSLSVYDLNKDGTISSNELVTISVANALKLQTNFLTKYDANADGTVTSAEVLAVTQASAEEWVTNLIKHLDRNADGSLSTNEFRGPLGGHDGPTTAELDIDKDGVLSKAELIVGAMALAEDRRDEVLAKFDTNKDGSISSEESLAVFRAEMDEKVAVLLKRYDTNGDGDITSAEVAALAHPRPKPVPPGHGGPKHH